MDSASRLPKPLHGSVIRIVIHTRHPKVHKDYDSTMMGVYLHRGHSPGSIPSRIQARFCPGRPLGQAWLTKSVTCAPVRPSRSDCRRPALVMRAPLDLYDSLLSCRYRHTASGLGAVQAWVGMDAPCAVECALPCYPPVAMIEASASQAKLCYPLAPYESSEYPSVRNCKIRVMQKPRGNSLVSSAIEGISQSAKTCRRYSFRFQNSRGAWLKSGTN